MTTPSVTIGQLNQMDVATFTDTLRDIFEHSAWIPERAASERPFSDCQALHSAMVAVVSNASMKAQLKLLRAHPQLAGKEAESGELTDASTSEQTSAKLNALTREEMEKITQLNEDYLEKFDFPFIIAVLNHSKDSIFAEFERRVLNDAATELNTALEQVAKIADFRLRALIYQ